MPILLPAFLGLCFCQLISGDVSENDTVVVTSSGSIKGMRVLTRSGAVNAYLGIPYAEPPVGRLRFQKPVPHQPWSHVLEATHFGKPCHQWTFFSFPSRIWVANKPHSEDCLFLNIWVPHPQPSVSVPILVWIHGGGFTVGTGSSDLYNGSTLAATENVIVASMNYRVGIWGFLFFPPEAPGNMGLWDQYLALNWLKENAAVFGGDADKLTLIGHSAGAASVGFHLLSPISQSLFDRAVLQSGAPNAPWASMPPEKIQKHTVNIIGLLNCRKRNDSAVMSCLQNKEADAFQNFSSFFLPTYDGDFLPEDPKILLQKGKIPAKPLLIGITREDGTVFIPRVLNNVDDDKSRTWEQALLAVGIILRRDFEEDIVKAILLKYSEMNHGSNLNRQILAHFSRDYYFVCPLIEVAARMVAAEGSVYVYSFDHQISTSIWQEWMGAAHGVEVPFLFGTLSSLPGLNQSDAEADRVLSQRVMHYWSQFARSG